MKKYSVLMSLYIKEKPEYLRAAIQSMIVQTCAPDEIVIVKDGIITEELQAVLNDFLHKHPNLIHLVGYEENQGLGFALNYGLEYCRNELVARMDTDDIAKADRCEKQLKAFQENPLLDIVGGDIAEFVDEPTRTVAYRRVPTTDSEIKEYMKSRCAFNHMTVMYKKTSVVRSGGYKDLFWNEDYYLWIRMMEYGCNMMNTGDVIVDVRTGTEMYKRRGGKKYFQSEMFLQKYMYERNIISWRKYIKNLIIRFAVQRMMPNFIRGFVYRTFARS